MSSSAILVEVHLGSHSLLSLNTLPSRKYIAKKVLIHALYSSSTSLNDIALIILDQDVTFNNYIQVFLN